MNWWDLYKVVKEIGKGGMARVYKVKRVNSNDKNLYALKLIKQSNRKDDSFTISQRFYNEVNSHRLVNSPYVCRFYESSLNYAEKLRDGSQFMLVEFIDGKILSEKIKSMGRIRERLAVDIAIKLCHGFSEIHRNGIIHRDIKSSNIMIDKYDNPKIIDLGISLRKDSSRVTKINYIIGSPSWIAPELVNGEAATVQSDIYALGLLLYEMVCGKLPYKSQRNDNREIISQIKHQSIPSIKKTLPTSSNGLANVIARATARNPKSRYSTMLEFAKDLQTCLNDRRVNEPLLNPNNLRPKKTASSVITTPAFIICAILFVVLILAIVIGVLIWKFGV
ncbi:serine/threonine protein kinase [Mycoplasmopsis californica]|uniref:Serine/threonine protein kinase n=1 Tax=Mycoplasmopsis equigenitalium TaxID=114883 RepID=A0ABY5J653_9BACT|nr:serine/threonine-protein kinase [Mycoplasmopsis equigenitalium]UUD37163.1 serine/threonine protein kinase [Mycoplasmopsis equigenitalium]VEU69531.1 serine/threonine protein kinase [Mycoplasmopsis californica]